jgi:DNA-binding Lrp family transcriptional regulator
LSAAQLAKLGPSSVVPDTGADTRADTGADTAEVSLQPGDDLLLAELARDGRTSNAALAATTHWHESTVRRRIAELCQAGLLYFDVDIDDSLLGIGVSAMLWLSVEPARLDEAGRTLAGHAEIPFVAAITGPSNLVASAVCTDTQHLYEYLTGPLARLPGVRSVETAPIIGTLKRTGSLR